MAITPFLKLYKPAANEIGWDDEMNANLDTLDSYISEFLNIPGFVGTWANSHGYASGQVVLDTVAGLFYECKVTHTSAAAPITFAADRAAHPTFWVVGTNHAQDSATAAAASAAAAAASAGASSTSAASSLSSLNSFKQTYYGSAAADPLTDPTGQARTAGDLYFNTTTQRLRVFVTTPTATWLEINVTQTFPDTPNTPVGAAFLRTDAHTWVEGVRRTGGSFTGNVGFDPRVAISTSIPVPSSAGQIFVPTSVGLRHAHNLYISTTAPLPATGGWRYKAPGDASNGAFVVTSDVLSGIRRTLFYTTPTNEVSVADGVANLQLAMLLTSGPAALNAPTLQAFGVASKPGGGVWQDSSDARIKNIVGPYPHGLTELLEMLPQMFTYKGNDYSVGADGQPDEQLHPDTTTQYIGLIGQECEEYMPELVKQTTCFVDDVLQTDVRQVDATGIVYALVNAVAELHTDIGAVTGASATFVGPLNVGNAPQNVLTITPGAATTNVIDLTPSGSGAIRIGGSGGLNVQAPSTILGTLTLSSPNTLTLAPGTAGGNPAIVNAASTTGGLQILSSASNKLGFNGTAPIAKPAVTGSRGGNAALASLITALSQLGLVTDSSTA